MRTQSTAWQAVVVLLLSIVALFHPSSSRAVGFDVPVPSQLVMTVRETAGIARVNEIVRSGVPLARSLNVRSTSSLTVVDAAGTRVPAEFRVLARWNAGLNDANAPIQWLMVGFPATVPANLAATYRLVTDGSAGPNPAPARPLTLTRSGNAVTVDTGAAIFRLGTNPRLLFDEVVLDNGTRLIGGGDLMMQVKGVAGGHPTIRKTWIEHSGPLSAVVVVEGAYDLAPVGNGAFSSVRRYVFTAGSPTAEVRHAVNWEGTLDAGCPDCLARNGTINGVLVERVRDTLALELGGTPTVTAVGAFGSNSVEAVLPAGQTAAVRQLLRSARTSPVQYSVQVGSSQAAGSKADGGMLAASGPRGSVVVGLRQMHHYEPQALRVLEDGKIALDLSDGASWLAHHQGTFAVFAVSALPAKPDRAEMHRVLWAPLNRPLRAWPEAAWFASSDAVEEFPVGALPADLASYDSLLSSVMVKTYQQIDRAGIPGLMTYGVFPRYWGQWDWDEMDCSAGGDPTPGTTWDNAFWCGTWTDYHNTLVNVPVWAMRSGDVEWLDELAVPGALRTLHTQIMQCGPNESWFYCGQAPAGYGGYRSDFNSSHAYFENLFHYYWLTGDSTVVRTVLRGGDSMRRYMCNLRGPSPVTEPHGPDGPACPPEQPLTAEMAGRVASQWISAFRFLGLASDDASFLEDFRSSLARAYTLQYTELQKNGVAYGFLNDHLVAPAGTNTARPLLQMGLYDTTNLFRLQRDTGDAPIGNPALAPSRILTAMARTMKDLEPSIMGDGTILGAWPHGIFYTYSGNRIGGALLTMAPEDRELYGPEKTTSTALMVRAGQSAGDAALTAKGKELTLFTLGAAAGENAPLGKLHGQYLQRLHTAVARLAGSPAPSQPATTPAPPTPPVAPAALTAQAVSPTEIVLTWTDISTNEERFRIERATGAGSFQEVQTVGAGITTARITGLTPATAYSFRVWASNTAGDSSPSPTVSAATPAVPSPPAAPAFPAARKISATEAQITWTDSSANETQFQIEQMDVRGIYQPILTLPANTTTVTVTGLRTGVAYTFRVRAVNAAGSTASRGANVNM